ncbi:SH2 domain-containing protein A-like [Lycium ferocissimum]|uniref:SH2 domain-containing protein A-like n=1 Tax=Lycium ferocissimum TaxID=112874 RepID=UPI0028151CFC|nr:SH2 domain-containing protein A-like [Lycium ferocissimum]
MGVQDYSFLRDLQVEFKDCEVTNRFSLCFWFYLNDASSLPSTILHQEHPDVTSHAPFLLLDETKKILLFPLLSSSHSNVTSWRELAYAISECEFPIKKWVHVGCEVTQDLLHLYFDGKIVGEKSLTSSLNNDTGSDNSRISLTCINGKDSQLDGYVHSAELFPVVSTIKNHYVKDPPVQLSIDSSSAHEIEEDTDGVWSIVGGKASCRRNFSLDVTLMDNFSRPMAEEAEVVASLVYSDNEAPVEKPVDAEAPLLTSYDGIEYASSDRPSKVISGRASFKLKISQLSSKCDNRLFRIRFEIPQMGKYPFLEVFSRPIRCISRNRSTRASSLMLRKSSLGIHLLNGSQSPVLEDGSSDLPCIVREAKQSPSSKRVKLGQEKLCANFKDDFVLKQANGGSRSHSWTSEDNGAYQNSLEARPVSHGGPGNFSSDSENSETTDSVIDDLPSNRGPISDLVVFKYCLGDLSERRLLLKEMAMTAKEEELATFAERVSLFSGCSHHRHQISISKRLITEGIRCWNLISNENQHVLWENLVSGLQEHFLKMTFGCTRSLTYQDFNLLRRVSSSQDLVSQDNFEKLWCWLYPVAFTLSQQCITSLWGSTSPMWIEGFITKEEAESSLRSLGGALQEPGTFILRFPTSRSWPHPDAGNLVVTYVGSNYTIHHRLLSLDFIYSSGAKGTTIKTIQDMLLEQPELRRLGRIVRSQ